MRSEVDATVVIVAYRTLELLRECLRSVPLGAGSLNVEVVVVDNAADDGTGAMVTSEFPTVRYVPAPENLGFARACNVGAALGSGEHVILLNPDTEVHDGAFEALVDFARRHPSAGIVGGRTLRPDGSLDPSSCWNAMSLWSLFCFATGLSAVFKRSATFDPESMGKWNRDTEREVGVVTGCLLAAPRSTWDELGGFDEDYFMYAEDADLSWRAHRAGYHPSITPDAVITHVVGASSPARSSRIIMRNKGVCTLIRKRWTGPAQHLALSLLLTGVALRAAGQAVSNRRPGRTTPSTDLIDVWVRRSDWIGGYPPRGAAGERVPEPG